jgi:hypothetical protein
MVDYALFEPRIWKDVCVDGTLEEFLSTAHYQIARRVRIDHQIGDAYPSFEMEWRRLLATRLQSSLAVPPVALCPSIHSVIPIGVSQIDALQAMAVAIPKDIQDPYAITVRSSAVEDRCGSIAITQPMRYTVVHVNCMLSPGLLVDVCRELRMGHRSVVSEVHTMSKQLGTMKEKHDEMNTQLSTMRLETNQQLTIIQREMATLVTKLLEKDSNRSGCSGETTVRCAKNGCLNVVTKRFRSGKMQKQCVTCVSHVIRTHTKRKFPHAEVRIESKTV